MTSPSVSVIIPTYNRAHMLPRALDSVVGQTFSDWEIVLVDDGSTDSTPALAADYAHRLGDRFRYLIRPHVGCCAARNAGIDVARGRFVAFLDSDDEFRPEKLARQMELFGLRPELGLVYCDYDCIDVDGESAGRAFDTRCRGGRDVPREPVAPEMYVCGPELFDVLLRSYFIATITGLVRREVLGSGIRFTRDPAYAEEWLFYLQVTRFWRGGFVDEPLCIHHFTPGSVSRTSSRMNLVRRHQLLRQMPAALAPLSRVQRRIIRDHVISNCRQLGFATYRDGAYRDAARFFGESFMCRPNVVDLGRAIESTLFRLRRDVRPALLVDLATQDEVEAVR